MYRVRTGSARALVVVLVGLYLGSVTGPPPPSESALVAGQLLGGLVAPWAYWIDRNRENRV